MLYCTRSNLGPLSPALFAGEYPFSVLKFCYQMDKVSGVWHTKILLCFPDLAKEPESRGAMRIDYLQDSLITLNPSLLIPLTVGRSHLSYYNTVML